MDRLQITRITELEERVKRLEEQAKEDVAQILEQGAFITTTGDKVLQLLNEVKDHEERVKRLEQNAHDANSNNSTLAIKFGILEIDNKILHDRIAELEDIAGTDIKEITKLKERARALEKMDPSPLNPLYCKKCGKEVDNLIDALSHEIEHDNKEGTDKAVVR